MGKKKTLTIVAVLILLAISAGCSGKAATEQERIKVARGDIVQSVNADGELSLPQQRKLSFGVNGKIDVVNVEDGAKVAKGQVLAKLETASFERAVSTAQLAVKSAEADRQQAEAGLRAAQADLKQAEYAVKVAQADQQQAENGVKTAEANVQLADYGVKTAVANKEQATDNFRKITYPYTYSTFVFDIPAAVDYLNATERQLAEARKGLQSGLTADQYLQANRQMQDAQDSLANARLRLDRGQGADIFSSGILTVKDYWTLRDAQLQMDKAQLALDTANGTLDIARLNVDAAKSAYLKAQLGAQSAAAAVDKAQAGVRTAEGVLGKAQVAVDVAKNNLDTAKESLDDATITAPFDGVVAKVDIKAGDILTPVDYTRTIFELIDPRRMEFTIKVDEIDIPGVAQGQEAAVSVDALPGAKLKGRVTFVSPLPVIQGGVVQYEVKIGFDVPEGSPLKAGMSSNATIATGQRSNVLLVPSRAITRNKAGKATVKLVVSGQAQERVVQTGVSNSADTEILSGLNEGDTILVERQAK